MKVLLSLMSLCLFVAAALMAPGGLFWINTFRHGGPTAWLTMQPTDTRLPEPIRLALGGHPPSALAGTFTWRLVSPGLEVGELPVLAEGAVVDRILLTRIDPRLYRFSVKNAPSGAYDLDGWMDRIHPAALINGSYYSWNGLPDTPFLSDDKLLSRRNSPPAQGAFTVTDEGIVTVSALSDEDWLRALSGSRDGLATYPLLIGPKGYNSGIVESRWVANRSFVGEDNHGEIVLGTTTGAFFSLSRFAQFLDVANLDLKVALNLDGGPVACQAVVVADYKREFCGEWEIRDRGGLFKVLKMPQGSWIPLPVVLAVFKK